MGPCFRDFRKLNNAKEERKSIETTTPKKCAMNIDMYPFRSLYRTVCGIQYFLEETHGTDALRKMEKNEN